MRVRVVDPDTPLIEKRLFSRTLPASTGVSLLAKREGAMRAVFRSVFHLAAPLCVIVLSASACSSAILEADDAAGPDAGPVVETRRVEMQAYERRLVVIGTSRARQTAHLRAESAGRVERVSVASSAWVEAGDEILRLEDREEVLAVQAAQTERDRAQRLVDRYQRLDGGGAVSRTQMEDALTALQSADIAVEQARQALRERSVIAPFSGRISLMNIDPGQRIDTATPITRLDDRSSLFVDFALPESEFGLLAPGDNIAMAAYHEGEAWRYARITAIDNEIDPASRTFQVRAELDNTDDALRSGMTFRVQVDIARGRHPVLPEVAVLWGSRGAYVWRVEQGVAHRTPIVIVERRDGDVLVEADLQAGDVIVSAGVQKVRDGQTVAVNLASERS